MPGIRDILPGLIGLVLALIGHAAFLPWAAGWVAGPDPLPNVSLRWQEKPTDGRAGEMISAGIFVRQSPIAPPQQKPMPEVWLVLSRNAKFDNGDVVLDRKTIASPKLNDSLESTFQLQAELPAESDGPYFLIAVLDADDQIDESNERDNRIATPIWVEGQQAAELAFVESELPMRLQAGGGFEVEAKVQNIGEGWARSGGDWALSISPDASAPSAVGMELGRSFMPGHLQPGQKSKTAKISAGLPLDLPPGPYVLKLQSDGPGEPSLTRQVVVEPASHPDLTVRDVAWPSSLTPGQAAVLRFSILNQSPIGTDDTLWADRVYLSVDDQLDADDLRLLSLPRLEPLLGGGSYRSIKHHLRIDSEHLVSSEMYLLVSTDDTLAIDEFDEGNNVSAHRFTIADEQTTQPVQQIKLGRAEELPRVTVAWIAYDDFQDVLARQSVTLQPIVQDRADPVAGAPLEMDPDTSSPQADAEPFTDQTQDPAVDQSSSTTLTQPSDTDSRMQESSTSESKQPSTEPSVDSATAPPTNQASQTDTGDRPTSAPRADREAIATTLIDAGSIRPGRVLVGPGLEVRTVRPDISATAAALAIPRNPVARITFNTEGKVTLAELTTGTGFDNVDGPILSSLYKWTATGKTLRDLNQSIQIDIKILLVDE
jgi:hypothetical protein